MFHVSDHDDELWKVVTSPPTHKQVNQKWIIYTINCLSFRPHLVMLNSPIIATVSILAHFRNPNLWPGLLKRT